MVQTFRKPHEARQCEARARARTLGVRVAVVSEARSYVSNSQSTPGTGSAACSRECAAGRATLAGSACVARVVCHGAARALRERQEGTDLAAIAEGRGAVTPLHFDLTDRPGIETLQAYDLARLRAPAAEELD